MLVLFLILSGIIYQIHTFTISPVDILSYSNLYFFVQPTFLITRQNTIEMYVKFPNKFFGNLKIPILRTKLEMVRKPLICIWDED